MIVVSRRHSSSYEQLKCGTKGLPESEANSEDELMRTHIKTENKIGSEYELLYIFVGSSDSYSLKSWRSVSPSSIPDKPRRDAVAAFRLTTGHDCLAAHLHRLGISTEPFCPLCDSGEVMERDHLLRCGALQGLTEVARYWAARALLGSWDFGLLFLLHVLL
ncbi:hypothetical protein AVEN_144657-1 [Araneus ventricosus]|uniref:Uncharacterized protein n=1 Tax=Araneus ventricosus TaxID=182803 RepID=A0A4Y2E328_ARAVE|nr:hypothetical protein AVEN_144657-1 [Araneus ventricosus]